jgi:adenine-specific DNA-methyltransferase
MAIVVKERLLQGLLDAVESLRLDATCHLLPVRRVELGQFLTPKPVARLMAGMLQGQENEVSILEAGAGVGTLFAAAVEKLCSQSKPPRRISVTAFEIDEQLAKYIPKTFDICKTHCDIKGIEFSSKLYREDFIKWAVEQLSIQLFTKVHPKFTTTILNPPYRKINSHSPERSALRQVGVETSNLYAAFLALAVKLLAKNGEMVAITPRSFCNGPYFKPFRELLLSECSITHAHVFDSRKTAFKDDDVLQENIILRALKHPNWGGVSVISTSRSADDPDVTMREVESLVLSGDPDRVIHIVPSELQEQVAARVRRFDATLKDLAIQVSTGRVVDFRAKESLVYGIVKPSLKHAPLIYPTHFEDGSISWPRESKKPNYLLISPSTTGQLVPSGNYVLVKRFSAKEEKRRISAAVCTPSMLDADSFAFENHLNYYHNSGVGLSTEIAYGLAVYLNSGLVDAYFRQFSGHTQVNASDLRAIPYPSWNVLEKIGRHVGTSMPPQDEIDDILASEVSAVATNQNDPLKARRKIDEALSVLNALGLPRAQQNDRSALTLLALVNVKPEDSWADGGSPLMGITPIMEFARDNYGTTYAPNSRETFRRQTMHQFVEAGIALYNPDKPDRPVNSPKAVYQIMPLLLDTLRKLGTAEWEGALKEWSSQAQSLQARYAKDRDMAKIPLKLPNGQSIELSPGGQNVLVEQIIHEFCPRFAPNGIPLYVGDTEEKYAFFDMPALTALGVKMDSHGKMPDVVIHYTEKNWLLLIEAVTSHGPVDGKRHDELKRLFKNSKAPLVFVTSFLDRGAMVRFLGDIAWETEVWVADAPSHMIHFNGERFLGPYPT